jgi:hypothetical protein
VLGGFPQYLSLCHHPKTTVETSKTPPTKPHQAGHQAA